MANLDDRESVKTSIVEHISEKDGLLSTCRQFLIEQINFKVIFYQAMNRLM